MTGSRPRLGDNFFLILCVIGAVAIFSSTMSKNPVLNPFAQSLGTPEDLMGIVAAASTLPGILFSLAAGSLSDIFGRKKILLVSSLLFASAPFLYLLVASWWQLALVRFYHGFATAIFIPVARAAIAEHYSTMRGEKISTFTSATIAGRSIAPFLGGFILSFTLWNFHTLYLAVGIAGVTTLFATLILIKQKDSSEASSLSKALGTSRSVTKPKSVQGWKEAAGNVGILVVSSVEGASYYVFGAVEFFFVGYLKNVALLDASLIGVISGMQLALIPIVNPFMGRLSDKIGRKIPILAGLTIGSLPLMAVSYTTNFFWLLAISVIYGLGFSMVTSSTPALVGDLSRKESYGAAMGFLATIMDVGQTIGPIMTGIILAASGYSGSFMSLGAILLGFGLVFAIYQKQSPKPHG